MKRENLVICRALGLWFARNRKRLNMTQAEFANLIGITQGQVSKIESGNASMDAATLIRCACKTNERIDPISERVVYKLRGKLPALKRSVYKTPTRRNFVQTYERR